MDIQGIGAFVSGGASGLGEATTRALVQRGARVAIADVNDDKANALAAELGDSAIAVHCDVTSEEETQAAVTAAVDAFGELRLAVGCAGVGWAPVWPLPGWAFACASPAGLPGSGTVMSLLGSPGFSTSASTWPLGKSGMETTAVSGDIATTPSPVVERSTIW